MRGRWRRLRRGLGSWKEGLINKRMKKRILFFLTILIISINFCTIENSWAIIDKSEYDSKLIAGTRFYYEISNDKVTIMGVDLDKSKDIVIPKMINGYPVKIIGEEAFCECIECRADKEIDSRRLKSIVIPEGIEAIESKAFCGCISLKQLIIPKSVKNIGDYAFAGCNSINNITISDGVETIEDYAFTGCYSLKNIKLPKGIKFLGEGVFDECSSLQSIDIDSINYSSIDGVLFNKDKEKIIKYPEGKKGNKYIIPNSIKIIDDSAFSNCDKLQEIKIPQNTTTIGYFAFSDCSSLENIKLPKYIKSLGEGVFLGCSSLQSIDINSINYSNIDGVLFDKKKETIIKYPEGKKESSYSIPNSVRIIGESAFLNCNKLREIKIPSGVKQIELDIFSDCKNLKSLYLSKNIKYIEDGIFFENKNLTIYCPRGSYAESYAKKKGINYKNNDGIMYKINEFFIMIKNSIFK